MSTILELKEKRANLVAQARELVERADAESRGMNAEENEQYDKIFGDIGALEEQVQKREKLEAKERELAALETQYADNDDGQRGAKPEEKAESRAWARFLVSGRGSLTGAELRALQADSDEAGGYLVAPQQFVNRLVKAIDDETFIYQWATKFPLSNAASMGAPALDADPADADWTSELLVGSEDSTMDFGKRELDPSPLAKLIKVSRKLLRLSPDVEGLVIERLGYKFGISFEKAGMTGAGANQPLGVYTAHANGINTDRDVSTGNTTTSIQFDGLKEAKYTLKSGYWRKAKWLFHRDGIKQIAKLQDDNGQYIWDPASVRGNEPDLLLGFPVYASEYNPNTFTTGQYVGILGDFSYYWIATAMDFSVQRLDELYAATNQVGFIGRLEADGMPVLSEAFVRVKLA